MTRDIATMILFALLVFLLVLPADAHGWYSARSEPDTYGPCCGGSDCNKLTIEPGVMEATELGYRIVLTVEQARKINHGAMFPIDAVVPWDKVQTSPDGNYHLCISAEVRVPPKNGIICFFGPPST